MAVPKYDWWYLPLLRLLGDGRARRMSEVYDELAKEAGLSEADLGEMLPSGTGPTYRNRIGWARTFLKKAGLVQSPKWGMVAITERGQSVLRENPAGINNAWLMRYPEFAEWARPAKSAAGTAGPTPDDHDIDDRGDETPRETLERMHAQLHRDLADELLERVKQVPPVYFEKIVVDLMLAMGYGGSRAEVGHTVGQSGDGGIDGVIDEDQLGLDKIYLQAKRWKDNIGRPIVQAFSGSLEGERATKGVFITTSAFTVEARDYVGKISKKIVLIDGRKLAELMIRHDVGVSGEATYVVKRIDGDYFDPDA
ncbi:MAG: restriction endonuclease [Rhodanobacter sp.]|nr:MAG: restriction endonuclease [Rhodanobacter sp.]TAM12513.1 MAG: restriction endonuclease [Rhodanobacter sp.]TAM34515.1 MAG: restriction endonuclease [Rhodanobacter sp.]